MKLEFPKLDTSERRWAYLRELMKRTLEIDWRERPRAADILDLVGPLSNEKMSDRLSTADRTSSEEEEESVPDDNHAVWKLGTWRRYWYYRLSSCD